MDFPATMKSKVSEVTTDRHGNTVINDNSKRSISMRISTSDYGRIKCISRRLRVGESEVFRYLIKVGLSEISALCHSSAKTSEVLNVFVEHGASLVPHFNLTAERLNDVINRPSVINDVQVDRDDLELLAMCASPERFLLYRLQELLGCQIDTSQLAAEMKRYLDAKYAAETNAPRPTRE
jgi:hypothetical protein